MRKVILFMLCVAIGSSVDVSAKVRHVEIKKGLGDPKHIGIAYENCQSLLSVEENIIRDSLFMLTSYSFGQTTTAGWSKSLLRKAQLSTVQHLKQ